MASRSNKAKVPFRNRSPSGWWTAVYVERFEYYDEDKKKLGRRCLAWENTILIKARDREQAYRKAIAMCRRESGVEWTNLNGKGPGAWRFEGLTDLLPVYDKLENGAELWWTEHKNRSVKTIKSWTKRKRDLGVFDDRDRE